MENPNAWLTEDAILERHSCNLIELWRLMRDFDHPLPVRVGGEMMWKRNEFERWFSTFYLGD